MISKRWALFWALFFLGTSTLAEAKPWGCPKDILLRVFKEDIAPVRRGTGREAALSYKILTEAKTRQLWTHQDAVGNVLIRIPATPGYEQAPSVAIQGHLDMVEATRPGMDYDWNRGIEVIEEGEWMHSKHGTSTGFDNALAGVAPIFVLIRNVGLPQNHPTKIQHGPLEYLLTVEEEGSFKGILNFDMSLIQSKIMLNLDHERRGEVCNGCAGIQVLEGTYQLGWQTIPATLTSAWQLVIGGLHGGHSGMNAHRGQASAVILMVQFIQHLQASGIEFGVTTLEGGARRAEIPAYATVDFRFRPEDIQTVSAIRDDLLGRWKKKHDKTDPGLEIQLIQRKTSPEQKMISSPHLTNLIQGLLSYPNGVVTWSGSGQPITSAYAIHVGALPENDGTLIAFVRSSFDRLRGRVAAKYRDRFNQHIRPFGSVVFANEKAPAWQPRETPLTKLAQRIFRANAGGLGRSDDIQVVQVHASLETALFARARPDIDAIAFGPVIEDPHSYRERTHVPSVYEFLLNLLDVLKAIADGELDKEAAR